MRQYSDMNWHIFWLDREFDLPYCAYLMRRVMVRVERIIQHNIMLSTVFFFFLEIVKTWKPRLSFAIDVRCNAALAQTMLDRFWRTQKSERTMIS